MYHLLTFSYIISMTVQNKIWLRFRGKVNPQIMKQERAPYHSFTLFER